MLQISLILTRSLRYVLVHWIAKDPCFAGKVSVALGFQNFQGEEGSARKVESGEFHEEIDSMRRWNTVYEVWSIRMLAGTFNTLTAISCL